MTSKFKCPICQNNLHKINIVVSTCTNDKCKLWGSSIPNLVLKALIQAKQDLDFFIKEQVRAQTALIERTKELDKCQKNLERSEKCCSAWETQALDYKAETIALSGKLEIAREALKNMSVGNVPSLPDDETLANAMCNYARDTLKQIEHKDENNE